MASFQTDKGRLLIAYRWQRRQFREFLGCEDTEKNRQKNKALLLDVTYDERKGVDPASRFKQKQQPVVEPALTFSKCAQDYFKYDLELPPEAPGRKNQEYCARHWLDEQKLPDGTTLGEIDARVPVDKVDDLKLLIRGLIQGRSITFTTKFLQLMRRVVEVRLIDKGIHGINIFRKIGNPKKVLTDEEIDAMDWFIQPLSPAEQIRLLNAVTGQDRLIIAIGLYCGLRPAEILRVQYQDIELDLETPKINVRGTKTGKAKRYIPLQRPVLEILRDELARQRAKLPAGVPLIGRMFLGPRLKRPIKLHQWRERHWHPALVKAGIKPYGPMLLRHTFAVDLLKKGVNRVLVAEQLGHRNLKMLDEHYGRFFQRPEETANERGQAEASPITAARNVG